MDNRLVVWGVGLEVALLLLINYTAFGNMILDHGTRSVRALAFRHSLGGGDAHPGGGAQVAGAQIAAERLEYRN
jgi:hypothetical protein